jgi:transcriptional regulator with XRE-family HTH domain
MTAQEFAATYQRMSISRAEFCRRLGIAPNSGTAYEHGRKAIPLTVALAAAAVEARIGPAADQ